MLFQIVVVLEKCGSITNRSSRPEVFRWKGVLKNFKKFTGKHLRQSAFLDKVADLRPAHVFSCEFCESFQNTFFVEHLRANTSEKGEYFNKSWFHCTNFDCEKLCHYLLSHALPLTSSNDDISNPIYILHTSFLALFCESFNHLGFRH